MCLDAKAAFIGNKGIARDARSLVVSLTKAAIDYNVITTRTNRVFTARSLYWSMAIDNMASLGIGTKFP